MERTTPDYFESDANQLCHGCVCSRPAPMREHLSFHTSAGYPGALGTVDDLCWFRNLILPAASCHLLKKPASFLIEAQFSSDLCLCEPVWYFYLPFPRSEERRVGKECR